MSRFTRGWSEYATLLAEYYEVGPNQVEIKSLRYGNVPEEHVVVTYLVGNDPPSGGYKARIYPDGRIEFPE